MIGRIILPIIYNTNYFNQTTIRKYVKNIKNKKLNILSAVVSYLHNLALGPCLVFDSAICLIILYDGQGLVKSILIIHIF